MRESSLKKGLSLTRFVRPHSLLVLVYSQCSLNTVQYVAHLSRLCSHYHGVVFVLVVIVVVVIFVVAMTTSLPHPGTKEVAIVSAVTADGAGGQHVCWP